MSTAVVHLVRRANGFEPFEAFVSAYEQLDAGHEHDLVLLFKGFETPEQVESYRRRAAAVAREEVFVSDRGSFVSALLTAAPLIRHERICFLTSTTRPLVHDWLGRLERALDQPGVGIAAASGSWASHRSVALDRIRVPNGYRGSLHLAAELEPSQQAAGNVPTAHFGQLRRAVKAGYWLAWAVTRHPGFPAPHIRLTGFLIERRLLLALNSGWVPGKVSGYRLESGHRSWTRQILDRGLKAVVVGRESGPLPPTRWPDADVFWQGSQRQLTIADKRTDAYDAATPAQRIALASFAWGRAARPTRESTLYAQTKQ